MSKIAWTNETWNPIIGCSKCSPGCANCYAERMAGRLSLMPATAKLYSEVVYKNKSGKFEWISASPSLVESALEKPLHWKKPRRIFICSMGDLFHESVPFEWIDRVMAIVALCPQHTFQILTKRPERIAEYFNSNGGAKMLDGVAIRWCTEAKKINPQYNKGCISTLFPLPNLWLGVTAENQEMADKRIPILLNIPAAKRFVSIEPMLEGMYPAMIEHPKPKFARQSALSGLDWVIVGCESGPGRRECKQEWIGSIVDQCREAGVKCFVKQVSIGGKVSHDPAEWPESLRVREFPEESL